MTIGTAPGKIVLFGEHSVVYNKPAIAAPVTSVKARVQLEPAERFSIDFKNDVNKQKAWKAIENTVDNTLEALHINDKNFNITIDSEVPIASGMGSGAAVGIATIRAITKHFNKKLTKNQISSIDFKTEQLLHTHPSGIDNTVISHEIPIIYQNGELQKITIGKPLNILIANTGIRSSTKEALEAVRTAWENNQAEYEGYFRQAGMIALEAKKAIELGELENIGKLMQDFQEFYKNIKMSHPANEKLIQAALDNEALGSKISGAGRGGCVIALIQKNTKEQVYNAWKKLDPEVIIDTKIR
ncbi:mevalonate kinase [archaeon]|nr:mevalonate kinase [archaeon]